MLKKVLLFYTVSELGEREDGPGGGCSNQEAHKQYLALAVGLLQEDRLRVDAPIDRHDSVQ